MKTFPALAIAGVAAVALAGTAVAASRNSHVMTLSLPDGSTAHIEYVGDVVPKVTIARSNPAAFGDWAPLPAFASFDRIFDEMNRQTAAMLRQAQQVALTPQRTGASPYVASFGNLPGGVSSTTIVSYSNGNATCTRTTESISQGPGKPPKVTSTVSGNCRSPSASVPAGPITPRLDHT